jgi:hypothetical protein
MASYRITWTETSSHEVELADHELAQLYGLTPATMEGYDLTDGEGLDDALAEYSDQGFMFLYRNDIEVEQIDPMPPRRPTTPTHCSTTCASDSDLPRPMTTLHKRDDPRGLASPAGWRAAIWSLTVDAVSVAVAALSAGPHRLHNDSVAPQNTGADPAVEKGKPLWGAG